MADVRGLHKKRILNKRGRHEIEQIFYGNDMCSYDSIGRNGGRTAAAPGVKRHERKLGVSLLDRSRREQPGYTLTYAPMPFTDPASIGSVDMGTQKSVSGELPAGTAFYVAVQSRDNTGVSQYSNVVSVIVGSYPIAADVFTTVQKTVSPWPCL